MKIRLGFVTNSSSSSFVVGFKKKPESVEELRQLLFGDEAFIPYIFGDERFSTYQLAETVFNDMKDQVPMTLQEIIEEFGSGYIEDEKELNLNQFKTKDGSFDWEAYKKKRDKLAEKSVKAFLAMNNKQELQFYRFHYGDESSYFAMLEHGDIFHNLFYQRISHH